MIRVVCLAVLALLQVPVIAVSLKAVSTNVLSTDDEDAKTRPVSKVIALLQDMAVELNKELEDDKAVYEEVSCWCQTNEKEKTQAIETGEARIEALVAQLGEDGAKIQELKATLANAKDKINKDFAALQEASAMRMKESKEFHGEENDLIGAVQACNQALVVLSKHHPDLLQVRNVAKGLEGVRAELLPHVLNGVQVALLKEFMRQAQNPRSFLGMGYSLSIPGMNSYAPQSGQIVGILKQMKEEFSENLSETQKSELQAQEQFKALKAAKEEEIAAGEKLVEETEADLAEFQEKHAQAMEELSATEDQVKTDKEFLANLRKRCTETDAEYQERVKSRMEEITAVQDTIAFLSSDEAFDLFDKTVNTAFLQVNAESSTKKRENALRQQAVAVLARVAGLGQKESPKIAMIAESAKLDAFTKVIEMIDKMIVELKDQQQDEVKHRDFCIAELNKNTLQMDEAHAKRESLQANIADLEATIKKLGTDIETTKEEIAAMEIEMKRAGEDRAAENADYQQTVNDHRITQEILTKALQRMKQVYFFMQEEPGAPQMQLSGNATDAGSAPARFKKMEKNVGGSKVVTMIEQIIGDSKGLEAEAIHAEEVSQNAYENFMKDSNKSITQATQSIADMTDEKAKSEQALEMAQTDMTSTNKQIENLMGTNADLHEDCDFILKNFEVRQDARAQEIDALGEAKAILSGMK
eukprot:gnl/MRDRNA2_/MRDRNA2_50555_c0_seq1.p1 gnl/MRDRNA2_/MRDRNA2_50555_c0~~gnl/MRDRNA2_/MRDRNA2_50555_c0_seq1.p1  ORF type:complete len:700 (-),score=229.58 gnl/MRDRNA2_/MRDRNA2_50555_c0_seq1:17-2116(-)